MALVPDSTTLSLSVNNTLSRATRAVGDFLAPQTHSPEYDLMAGPLRDPRLAPRVPMDSSGLDAGLLAQLSSVGMKRAKQVSYESHPELMRAWKAMSQRAGLAHPPQLIIAESESLNALTVTKDEVVITTGLLKILDLPQTVAVLGHELGHATSDHVKPRLFWTGALGGAGAWLGNEFGRHGGANTLMHKIGTKLPFVETLRGLFYPKNYAQKASSLLGYALYVGAGASAGAVLARNISVRPTELDADAKGAAISGDPLSLASALEALQAHSPRSTFMGQVARIQSGYPTMDARISNLQAIAQQGMTPVLAETEAHPEHFASTQESKNPKFAVSDITSAERVGAVQGAAIT